MNIKEAFSKLAKSTANSMKNPFFVIAALDRDFHDIAENIKEEMPTASDIPFDNTGTSLVSDDVQGAIEEVNSALNTAFKCVYIGNTNQTDLLTVDTSQFSSLGLYFVYVYSYATGGANFAIIFKNNAGLQTLWQTSNTFVTINGNNVELRNTWYSHFYSAKIST